MAVLDLACTCITLSLNSTGLFKQLMFVILEEIARLPNNT